jgi:hypothetical protein
MGVQNALYAAERLNGPLVRGLESMKTLTRQFWMGLLAGVGLGLMLGAALVELELLRPDRKAWIAVGGSLLMLVGVLLAKRAPGEVKN